MPPCKRRRREPRALQSFLRGRYNVSLKMWRLVTGNTDCTYVEHWEVALMYDVYKWVYDWVRERDRSRCLDLYIQHSTDGDSHVVFAWPTGHRHAFEDTVEERNLLEVVEEHLGCAKPPAERQALVARMVDDNAQRLRDAHMHREEEQEAADLMAINAVDFLL